MRRLANGTQAAALPTPAPITGTPGYGIGGNPGLGVQGSIFDADVFNTFQEELFAFLTAAGISPDNTGADLAQVLKSAKRLFGGSVTTLSANTTLTADHAGLLFLSASGGVRTFTLPLAAAAGGAPIRLTIVRTDSAVNALNLVAQGSDTLNGLTSSINCPLPVGATVVLMSDGVSAWRLVAAAGLVQDQAVTASGNATVPWFAAQARVRLVGGGGGGGGGNGSTFAGAGGGAGGYSERTVPVTPGATIACTVGIGGVQGSNGGTTSFGPHCSATGGSFGQGSTSSGAGGGPGTGTGGTINLQGGFGNDGSASNGSLASGSGGASAFGGGGRAGAGAGAGGVAPGSGGGGCYGVPGFGGPGADGIILVGWLA